jgi:hypothetical protein
MGRALTREEEAEILGYDPAGLGRAVCRGSTPRHAAAGAFAVGDGIDGRGGEASVLRPGCGDGPELQETFSNGQSWGCGDRCFAVLVNQKVLQQSSEGALCLYRIEGPF